MKSGFTLAEVLVSLIIAVVSVLIMIQAFRMYMDSRNIAILYEKAYEDMNTAYEVGRQIIMTGSYSDLEDVEVVNLGTYDGCNVYRITVESSEIRSIVGEENLRINPELLSFRVLHCSE